MLDKYFNNAIIIDLLIATFVSVLLFFLLDFSIISLPTKELLLSTTSDIANVSFTSSGFVLTFLTLLVSFKGSIKPFTKEKDITLEDSYKNVSLFNIFLNSGFYDETIKHLKNGVKVLIIVAIIGYLLKLTLPIELVYFLFYFNVSGLVLISLVLWRSLMVLSGVVKVQSKK